MSDIIVSLDLSVKPGFAVYRDGKLAASGTEWPERVRGADGKLRDKGPRDFGPYPTGYIECAHHTVKTLLSTLEGLHSMSHTTRVVIEETTASNNNYSQKILEFIHFHAIEKLHFLYGITPVYVRDGVWKRMTGANQNSDERSHNAKIARIKKTGRKLAKIDGKVVGKKSRYDYYVRAANETFGLALKKDDNDQAAAILLGYAYLNGAPTCDGTTKGGLIPKEGE